MFYGLATYSPDALFGLGATAAQTAAAQRQATAKAKAAANQAAAKAKQAANKVAAANKAAAAKQKRLMKVAGKTVSTSNPNAASALHTLVTSLQAKGQQATTSLLSAMKPGVTATAKKTALTAATSTLSQINEAINKPAASTTAPTTALRGMGYMGSCIQNADGSVSDNGDGNYCPSITAAPALPYAPAINTGLSPGFGVPQISMPSIALPTAVTSRARSCQNGSNSAFCIIYNMSVDEQSQFQYIFQILQQMYAQLLQIVQQLMAQLQSAQQQPYAAAPYNPYDPNANPYAQTPYGPSQYGAPGAQLDAYGNPISPYGQTPYGQTPYGQTPYQDPNAMYAQQAAAVPQYSGQYQGPAAPATAYAPGSGSAVPTGYDTGGASAAVAATAPATVVAQQQAAPQMPRVTGPGVPPTVLISSDQLPVGSDQQAQSWGGDDAGGIVPQATQFLPSQGGDSMSPPDVSQFDPTTTSHNDLMYPSGMYAGSGASYGADQSQQQLYPQMPSGVISSDGYDAGLISTDG